MEATATLARRSFMTLRKTRASPSLSRRRRPYSSQEPLQHQHHQRGRQQQQQQQKQTSPHIGFYKSFGRPIAKVFLMSIAVYQITYWTWVKLESDEMKREQTAVVDKLEAEVRRLASSSSSSKNGSGDGGAGGVGQKQ